jgi:hypothetical protein
MHFQRCCNSALSTLLQLDILTTSLALGPNLAYRSQRQWLQFLKLHAHKDVPADLERIYRCVQNGAKQQPGRVMPGSSSRRERSRSPDDSEWRVTRIRNDVHCDSEASSEVQAESSQAHSLSSPRRAGLSGHHHSSSHTKLMADILEFCRGHFLFAGCSERSAHASVYHRI